MTYDAEWVNVMNNSFVADYEIFILEEFFPVGIVGPTYIGCRCEEIVYNRRMSFF